MFANALNVVRPYTRPIILSQRFQNGRLSSGCATGIVLNPQGWFLTCAHVIEPFAKWQKDQSAITAFEAESNRISNDTSLSNSIKKNKLKNQKPDPNWVTHCSAFWGGQNWNIQGFIINGMADLALGQIQNFNPSEVSVYPVFKDPTSSFPHGRSLCRLGFPFYHIEASFDENTKQFMLPSDTFPVPMFPNDGIYTREVNAVNGSQTASFIETSTPGLRGQSGGPIFDVDGNVWAVQSRTLSLPLGFAPRVTQGNKETTEHQFMHVGHGAHSREVRAMLDANNVTCQWVR
jgi:hypothetical protein